MVAVREVLRVGLVIGITLMLTGCMQALQTGNSALTPAPSQSSTTLSGTFEKGTPMVVTQTDTLSSTHVVPVSSESLPVTELPVVAVTLAASPSPSFVPSPVLPTMTPTMTPTATPMMTPTATSTPIVTIVLPTLPALTNEQRWRNQQDNRVLFDALRSYSTNNSMLWWYDPVNQQHVPLGSFAGAFDAQATFTLVKTGAPALEVPYHVNQSYGITALSPALLKRIVGAGYGEWIETYVIISPEVTPQ